MRDNYLIIYKNKGERHFEFCPFCRVETIKRFADEVISIEYIG